MKATSAFVSVVAPVSNDADIIEAFVDEILGVLESNYANYELVLVDDGSSDASVDRVTALLDRRRCTRLIRLTRHYGTEVAIAAGLDSAIGDYVVVMLPDSDPPALVPELVSRARAIGGMVYGVRELRGDEPVWAKLGASVFYRVFSRVFDLHLVRDSSFFRVLTRQSVNAMTRMKDKYRYLRLVSLDVTPTAEAFRYRTAPRRAGARHRSLHDLLKEAVDVTVAHSTRPLRLVSALGLVASGANLVYMCYVVAIYLFKSKVAEGWTTTSLQLSGMFFLLFLILAVVGEYLVRILEESRDRPLYNVLEERNSNILVADASRRNIVSDSIAASR